MRYTFAGMLLASWVLTVVPAGGAPAAGPAAGAPAEAASLERIIGERLDRIRLYRRLTGNSLRPWSSILVDVAGICASAEVRLTSFATAGETLILLSLAAADPGRGRVAFEAGLGAAPYLARAGTGEVRFVPGGTGPREVTSYVLRVDRTLPEPPDREVAKIEAATTGEARFVALTQLAERLAAGFRQGPAGGDADVEATLATIESLALAFDLETGNIRTEPAVAGEGYTECPILITVRGAFADIVALQRAFEAAGRFDANGAFIRIEPLAGRDPSAGPAVIATFLVKKYFVPGMNPAKTAPFPLRDPVRVEVKDPFGKF